AAIRRRVVFPVPLPPVTDVIAPRRTERSSSWRTGVPLQRLVTPRRTSSPPASSVASGGRGALIARRLPATVLRELEQATLVEAKTERVEILLDLGQRTAVVLSEGGGRVANGVGFTERLEHLRAGRVEAVVGPRLEVQHDRFVHELAVHDMA